MLYDNIGINNIMSRTDLTSATIQIMNTIEDGESYTLNHLCKETKLNFRTVQKILNLIEIFQEQLESTKINITRSNHLIHVQAKAKTGMTSMPANMQKMLIRTSYYPEPDRDDEMLVYLLQKSATKKTSAIQMDSSMILDELVAAEHIVKKGKKYYLSEMGTTMAKGALSLYPELVQ